MFLENGVVRTMDSALPLARALAIAGDRVAGGVGTHERALPSPEVVDLGGRCVLPGFTDSHVHFPSWSLAQRDVKLDGVDALAEALDRVRSHGSGGTWVRGTGWRSSEWETQPTKEALDEVTGSTPAALWAKDYHSLWLNSAALALADDDLEVDGGVVERDASGEPTGILREESAWQYRARFSAASEDEWVGATRDGLRLAASRGVVAVHDKDGWLGAARIFQRIADDEGLNLRVWQSVPYERLDELESLTFRSRLGEAIRGRALPDAAAAAAVAVFESNPAIVYGRELRGEDLLAAADGVVTSVVFEDASTGRVEMTITDTAGTSYHYAGFNDDNPGTDDGDAPPALRLTALAHVGTAGSASAR